MTYPPAAAWQTVLQVASITIIAAIVLGFLLTRRWKDRPVWLAVYLACQAAVIAVAVYGVRWLRKGQQERCCDWCEDIGRADLKYQDCECTQPCENKPWCRATRQAARHG